MSRHIRLLGLNLRVKWPEAKRKAWTDLRAVRRGQADRSP